MICGVKIVALLLLDVLIIVQDPSTAFLQHDWHMIHERALVRYYNPKLFSNGTKFELRFFNRTTKAYYWLFELMEDLDSDLKVHFNAYKLYSNEYRGFPITVTLNWCEELERGSFGFSDMKKYSNITNCPWKKGLYILKDFVPDERKFPPFIPHGRYKAVSQYIYNSKLLYEVHTYHEVKGIKRFGNTTLYM